MYLPFTFFLISWIDYGIWGFYDSHGSEFSLTYQSPWPMSFLQSRNGHSSSILVMPQPDIDTIFFFYPIQYLCLFIQNLDWELQIFYTIFYTIIYSWMFYWIVNINKLSIYNTIFYLIFCQGHISGATELNIKITLNSGEHWNMLYSRVYWNPQEYFYEIKWVWIRLTLGFPNCQDGGVFCFCLK